VNRDEVNHLLRQKLGEDVHRNGWVCYTGLDAIKKGRYYIMGYNPRIDPANRSLLLSTKNLENWSAYTMQCWNKSCKDDPCVHRDASGRLIEREIHQDRVVKLAGLLETRPESIFSANAIFVESETAAQLRGARALWEKCWEVHKRFLAEVQPKWIICLGNGEERSSYSLLRRVADDPIAIPFPPDPARHPRYPHAKAFRASFDIGGPSRMPVSVLGLPHPSRWGIPVRLQEFIETEKMLG
jgi:hypothetical protein